MHAMWLWAYYMCHLARGHKSHQEVAVFLQYQDSGMGDAGKLIKRPMPDLMLG